MELKDIREKIDRLDLNLLDLINERAALGLEIGEAKKISGKPVLDKTREKEIVLKMIEKNPGPLSNEAVEIIFKKIIEENRNLQQKNIPV